MNYPDGSLQIWRERQNNPFHRQLETVAAVLQHRNETGPTVPRASPLARCASALVEHLLLSDTPQSVPRNGKSTN